MKTRASVLDVENAARVLLKRNGKTTTLEIKHYMWKQDFEVYQEEVAQSMYAVWAVNGWHWTFNGTYRTYYPTFEDAQEAYDEDVANLKPVEQTSWLGWLSPQVLQAHGQAPAPQAPPAPSVSAQMVSSKAPAPPARPPIDKRLAKLSITTKIFADEGDWMAYLIGRDKDGNVPPPIYVTGTDPSWDYDTARDTVRTYAKQYFNADYFDIRANKIK